MTNRKHRSAVLNVSSIGGMFPFPNNCTYSATKRFVDFVTFGLSYEVRQTVDLMTLRPGLVATKMTGAKESLVTATAKHCVQGTLDDLGQELVTYGSIGHHVQSWIHTLMNTYLPFPVRRFMFQRAISAQTNN